MEFSPQGPLLAEAKKGGAHQPSQFSGKQKRADVSKEECQLPSVPKLEWSTTLLFVHSDNDRHLPVSLFLYDMLSLSYNSKVVVEVNKIVNSDPTSGNQNRHRREVRTLIS